MNKDDKNNHDVIDDDLYEEIDDEELVELVEAERKSALKRAHDKDVQKKPKRPFPKWAFWLIVIMMLLNVFAFFPKVISVPAIEFLITSSKLSLQDDIRAYKKAVVVIETGDSRGTGFSINGDGTIITNHHVIEGEENVTVAFPDEGLQNAEVIATYPSVDLAVLETEGKNFPSLDLAKSPVFTKGDPIYFIGNPLRFQGIANKGTIIEETMLPDWKKPVVMIDAPVYHGNSGSPVLNKDGKVIGVVFATLDSDEHGKVGLYIPIEVVQKVIK
ncbi:S1C family serine protease [Virgibacillus necropolis]|uniref:Serine protease n=1 Tax=Virgibacillus necropolis TaxID=163877 RepID=A0A221MG37_9BACI|nr:serine protease [Virgibacillus necropolis]ASN06628.1 serine protease [Virgibacillus necropolis]